MHRSGTSAMAKVLSIAGAALPRDLIPPGLGNEAGHWEPINVANFNDQLLAKLDSRWDSVFAPRRNRRGALPLSRYKAEAREIIRDQYGDESLIVLKEPRITLLIDFWEEVLREEGFQCVFVIMARDPEEVAASLKARDQIQRNHALLLWATYTSQADLLTRHARRVFCSFDRLLGEPEAVLDAIEDKLEVDLPRRTVKATAEIDQFLQPTLRHHARSEGRKLVGPLSPVSRLSDYWFELVSGNSPNEDIASLTQEWLRSLDVLVSPMLLALEDRAQSAIAETHRLNAILQDRDVRLSSWENEVAALHQRLEAAAAQRQAELAAKEQSLSELEAVLGALRSELQQSRESWEAADAARAEEASRRAQSDEALAQAQASIEAEFARRRDEVAVREQAFAELEQSLRIELQQKREGLEAADTARIEEARRRAESEAALAQAQATIEAESAQHRGEVAAKEQAFAELEQSLGTLRVELQQTREGLERADAARIEAVSGRAESEAALARAQTRYEQDLAHVRRVEQEASAAHVAAAIAGMESRLAELNVQLVVAAESENAQNALVHGLRTELASHLTSLAQAREQEADTLLALNSLRGEAALSAAERSQAQGEAARLQAELATQRQLVADQASALAGYQRSILFRSRELILRARASMLGRRRS
jgi:hypothetical protein